jgi:CcmD family protein
MGYLVAAYAVFWGLTFVFVFSIASRQRNLTREIETLEKAFGEKS